MYLNLQESLHKHELFSFQVSYHQVSEWKRWEENIDRRTRLLYASHFPALKPLYSLTDIFLQAQRDKNIDSIASNLTTINVNASKANVVVVLRWMEQVDDYYKYLVGCRILGSLFSGIGNLLQEYLTECLDELLYENCSLGRLDKILDIYSAMVVAEIFSYFKYFQSIIGRGMLDKGLSEQQRRFFLDFGLPYSSDTVHILRQRYLFGLVDDKAQVKANLLDSLKGQIGAILGRSFSEGDPFFDEKTEYMMTPIRKEKLIPIVIKLKELSPAELAGWLCEKVVSSYTIPSLKIEKGTSSINHIQYSVICYLLEEVKDYYTLLEISIWLMQHSSGRLLAKQILCTFRRNKTVFALLQVDELIFTCVYEKYKDLRESHIDHSFLGFLSRMLIISEKSISDEQKILINSDLDQLEKKVNFKDLHNEAKYIQELQDDKNSIARTISKLAYPGRSKESVSKIFSYMVTSIQQRSKINQDANQLWRYIDICVYILWEIHSASGFLDLCVTNYIKVLSQKLLDMSSGSPVKSFEDFPWRIYFLCKLLILDCISIRIVLKTVFEPAFMLFMERPNGLENSISHMLLDLFLDILGMLFSDSFKQNLAFEPANDCQVKLN
jgi:hypothetical protein